MTPATNLHTHRAPTLAVVLALGLAASGASTLADCDADSGRQVYNKCVACHSLAPGEQRMGPSLHALLGKPAGSEAGFVYSLAMEESGLVWDAPTLHAFLAAPMQYLPGTSMPFAGLKSAQQRAALLCFLKHDSNENNIQTAGEH